MTIGLRYPTSCVLADLPEPGTDDYERQLWASVLDICERSGKPYTADDVQEMGEFLVRLQEMACEGVPA